MTAPAVTVTAVDSKTGEVSQIPAENAFDAWKSGAVNLVGNEKIPLSVEGRTQWVSVSDAQEYAQTLNATAPTSQAVTDTTRVSAPIEAFGTAAAAAAIDQTAGWLGATEGRRLLARWQNAQPIDPNIAALSPLDPRRIAAETQAEQAAEAAGRQRQALVQHWNPGASLAGEIAGSVAGEAAVMAATGGVGGLAARAPIAMAALTGGSMGYQSAREQAFLSDTELSASAAWEAASEGALWGAGLGTAGRIVGGLAGRAYRAAAEAGGVQGAARAFGAALSELAGDGSAAARRAAAAAVSDAAGTAERAAVAGERAAVSAERAAASAERAAVSAERGAVGTAEGVIGRAMRAGGAGEEAVTGLVTGAEAAENRALLAAKTPASHTARELHAAIDDFAGHGNAIDRVAQARVTHMAEHHVPQLAQGQHTAAQSILAQQTEAVESLTASLSGLSGKARKSAKDVIGVLESELAASQARVAKGGQNDIFWALNDNKRAFQSAQKRLRTLASDQSSSAPVMSDRLGKMASTVNETEQVSRAMLVDESVWGQKVAKIQRNLNEAYEEILDTRGKFAENFLHTEGLDYNTGRAVTRASSNKTASFSGRIGEAGNADAERYLAQQIMGTKKMLAAAEELGMVGDDVAATRAAVNRADAAYSHARRSAEVRRWASELAEVGSQNPVIQAAGHIPVVGPAVKAAAQPMTAVHALGALERATSRMGITIDSAVGQALGAAHAVAPQVGRVAGAGVSEAARGASRVVVAGASAERARREYPERALAVAAMSAPGAMRARVAEHTAEVSAAAPKVSAALADTGERAMAFLRGKLPVSAHPEGILGSKRPPQITEHEARVFDRYWTGALAPLEAVKLIGTGQATREHIEALRTVHPAVFRAIQTSVVKQAQANPQGISPKSAAYLDILLDLNGQLDPRYSAKNLQIMSTSTQSAAQQQRPGGPPPQTSARLQTHAQQLGAR